MDYLNTYTDGFEPEIGIVLGSGLGEIADVYCEYKRQFDPGLRFIDQNGNKWVTLGGYMLYHYE